MLLSGVLCFLLPRTAGWHVENTSQWIAETSAFTPEHCDLLARGKSHWRATPAITQGLLKRSCCENRGCCLVPAARTLGPSDDGDDCKHIIVSSDVTALKGMLLPSQVTLRPFPHHFSPVLNSRPRPLSFNYLPLLSARLRPAGVRHSPELRLWPQLLVPVSAQNCTKQQKRKGKWLGLVADHWTDYAFPKRGQDNLRTRV